ncbi:MAG: hypothetical protein WBO04_04725 [Steroidobacteraceae bacterium]
MRYLNLRSAGALFALALCSSQAQAANGGAALHCAGVSDDRERLACYDGIFRQPAAALGAAVPAASAVPSASVAPAPGNPVDEFGLSEAARRARDPEKAKQLPESVTAQVARVRKLPTGELVVTLENGQVWTQIGADPRARVATGDTVTIKKASLGSYLLVTASRIATRVRRVE